MTESFVGQLWFWRAESPHVRIFVSKLFLFFSNKTCVFVFSFFFVRPDCDKLSGMQRLLKAYQEEIDTLGKRSRASDSAFFSLYKALYEAPDPAQALERSASERPRAAALEVYSDGGVQYEYEDKTEDE